jgi:hypothetical protein
MVESVAASTYCFVSGESICPTSTIQVKPGKYSKIYVMTYRTEWVSRYKTQVIFTVYY